MSADRANQLDPGKLWNLGYLMERYGVGELVDLQSFFSAMANMSGNTPGSVHLANDQAAMIRAKAETYLPLLEKLDLHVSARAMSKVLLCFDGAEIEAGGLLFKGQNKANLDGALRRIADTVGDEMHTKLFLMLPAAKVSYFEQGAPPFGSDVLAAFPDADEDISEAAKCFALDRNTAAVFHLMRALERAVQVVADKLGATVSDAEGRTLPWGVIASNMKPIIDAMQKGSADQIKWYRIQAQLEVINRAWRAPTAHPKQTYTSEETEDVLNAAKGFMRELAPLV